MQNQRYKHKYLDRLLKVNFETKFAFGAMYSGGNQNRGKISFAYFLAILSSYEKSYIWLLI